MSSGHRGFRRYRSLYIHSYIHSFIQLYSNQTWTYTSCTRHLIYTNNIILKYIWLGKTGEVWLMTQALAQRRRNARFFSLLGLIPVYSAYLWIYICTPLRKKKRYNNSMLVQCEASTAEAVPIWTSKWRIQRGEAGGPDPPFFKFICLNIDQNGKNSGIWYSKLTRVVPQLKAQT